MQPRRGVGAVLLAIGCFVGCATGTSAIPDSGVVGVDSGAKDGAKDTGSPKDTGSQGYDTGSQGFDSGSQVDSGGCGTCLGNASTCCGTTCVDTTSDSNNCGTCNNGCTGTTCCNSSCTDTTTDNSNCGTCNNTCGNGMTCQASVCTGGNTNCTFDLGSCAHSPCTTGGALTDSCDTDGVTFIVCFYDPTCCTTTWDSTCVSWTLLFGEACTGC